MAEESRGQRGQEKAAGSGPERATSVPVVPEREARGAVMPALGFGTWDLGGEEATAMVEAALEMGYRHLDTAEHYGNDDAVARGWESSGIPRRELFITSKVWQSHFEPMEFKGAVEATLERLRTDYLDLLLLHWPVFQDTDLEAAVERLNAMQDEKLTRHIGVSNFTTDHLDRAWSATTYPLITNQVEYHPFLDQGKLRDDLADREMILTAYCPVARGRTARSDVLREIGEAHGKTGPQVALRWLLQQDAVPIPRTSDPEHARENLAVFDFSLSRDEMDRIGALHDPDGRIIDPKRAPDWDGGG